MISDKHIVAKRRITQTWSTTDLGPLQKAREAHDAGTVTMCQGRKDGFVIQYAIPNHPRVKRTPYFSNKEYVC